MKPLLLVVLMALPYTASQVAPAPPQTIRIEPVDATHVRLRLEGKEAWIVESAAFSIVPDGTGRVRLQGSRGTNTIRTNKPSLAENFELMIERTGTLGFQISNAKPLR